MTNTQPDYSSHGVPLASEIVLALNALYIVSSALAQRGAYAQEIRDSQWRIMAQRVHEAKWVLDQLGEKPETHAIALLNRMAKVCLDLVDRHAAQQDIPIAIWREVGRLGSDAYDCINATSDQQP